MSSEIRAGVRLSLNDQFSPSIKRAGLSAQGFRDKAVGAAEAVNKAFSGLSGTLATVGVGLGAAALVREGIGFQDAVTRIATSAGKFGDEASEFGKRLLRVAVESGVSKNELLAFAQVAADGGVLLEDIAEPLPFMADMIQGIGLSGAEAGDLLGVFFSRGANADALVEKMSEIVAIFGELGNVGVPKFVRYVRSLLEESGTAGVDGIVDMFVAMNMLATGTNNASQAHYQLRSALRDLGDADVQRAIRGWTGFEVGADGGIKSFLDAARELSEFAERRGIGNFENFEAAFGFSEATIRALSQYGNHFDSTVARIADLGDTSDAVARRAERNAATIQSSLNRLGAAALDFANSTLMGPIERLATLLNENPDGMKRAVQGVAGALAVIGGIKISASVLSLVNSIRTFRGGGLPGQGLSGGLSGSGGAPIPVFVTNMGPGLGNMGRRRPAGRRMPSSGRAGAGARGRTPRRGAGNPGGAARPRPRPRTQPALPGVSPPSARLAVPPARPGAAPPPPASRPPAGSAITATAGRTTMPPSAGGLAGGAGLGAAFAAISAIPHMAAELRDIAEDYELTDRERGEARGGAIGEAAGYIAGYAAGGAIGTAVGVKAGALAGAKLGAALGTVVPGVGNIVGLLVGGAVGAGVGLLGGRAGRAAGEAIGRASAGGAADAESPEAALARAARPHTASELNAMRSGAAIPRPAAMPVDGRARDEARSLAPIAREAPPLTVDGEIVLRSELCIDDQTYRLRQSIAGNSTPYKFAVGSASDARTMQ